MTDTQNPHLQRAARLVTSTDLALEPAPPLVAPAEVGASEALGFRNDERNVHVSLYLFEKQAQHAEASKALRQMLPAQGVYSNFSSNGPVLFVGHTPNDGSNGDPIQAKHRVARIASAFAGEE